MKSCNVCGEINPVMFYVYANRRCKKCTQVINLRHHYKKRHKEQSQGARTRVSLQAVDGKKYCTGCERYLDVSNFTPNRRHKDGLQYGCRDCYNKRQRELSIERCSAGASTNSEAKMSMSAKSKLKAVFDDILKENFPESW